MAEDGLICAFLLDGQGGGREIDWAGIAAWRPGAGLLWVHLDLAGAEAARWLREGSGLDPVISRALLAEDVRPRTVGIDGALLVTLRGVAGADHGRELASEDDDVAALRPGSHHLAGDWGIASRRTLLPRLAGALIEPQDDEVLPPQLGDGLGLRVCGDGPLHGRPCRVLRCVLEISHDLGRLGLWDQFSSVTRKTS
jgi:hypothetical protein